MTIFTRNEPKSFNDLVFHDPKVAETIRQYTTGERTENLLLYGPPGSGKSMAAEIIVNSCLANSGFSGADAKFDLPTLEQHGFEIVAAFCRRQKLCGAPRCYTIIDEVDHLKPPARLSMRTFVDDANYVTLVCTTNNLHMLDAPLRDRFTKLHLELPTASDWIPRASQIMQAEGHPVTQSALQKLLGTKPQSARHFMRQLDAATLLMKSKANASVPPTVQASNVSATATPALPAQPTP